MLELGMPKLIEFQPNCIEVKMLKQLQELHNSYFTFHLPEDLDIGHFNPRIREANLQIIEETIDIAHQIQSPIINMHMNSGIYFTLPTH